MKIFIAPTLVLLVALSACFNGSPEEEPDNTEVNTSEPEVLVEEENGMFTEYYPGKKQIKFQGGQDAEKRRHGIWHYYSETGLQLSMTEYNHGKKSGVTVVKYPNGSIHYTGTYENDQQVGVWKTYNEKGELVTEKDFGSLSK